MFSLGLYRKTCVSSAFLWAPSPTYMGDYYATVRYVTSTGGYSRGNVDDAGAARPVVTLSMTTEISEGEGTYESPYIVE